MATRIWARSQRLEEHPLVGDASPRGQGVLRSSFKFVHGSNAKPTARRALDEICDQPNFKSLLFSR